LVLFAAAGWWIWRWSRRGDGRRWAYDGYILLLLGWQLGYNLFIASPASAWSRFARGLMAVCFCVGLGFCVRDCFRWWRSRVSSGPGSLRGQLALILLPVTVLAIAGMISLAHDRAAVEDSARRRAGEIARDLAAKLSETLLIELVRLEQAGDEWNVSSLGPYQMRPAGYPPPRLAPFPSEWQQRYPLPPAEVLPLEIRYDANGTLRLPPTYPPVPVPVPATGRHPEAAAEAWDSLMRLVEQGADLAALDSQVRALERLSPDPELAHRLAFLKLLWATNRFERGDGLLALAESAAAQGITTESGIPLGIAAVAEVLRDPPMSSLTDEWARPIAELTLTQPSSLTPWMLDRAEELARRSSDVGRLAWVGELRSRWRSAERRRGLAAALRTRLPISAELVTNVWLAYALTNWLAVVQPGTNAVASLVGGKRITNEVSAVGCRMLREDVLGYAVHHAAEVGIARNDQQSMPSPPSVPAGLKISVEIEGRLVSLPRSDWAAVANESSERVLAEAAGELPAQAIAMSHFQKGQPWPSRPKFTVRVHLADSAALFVAQRRQQWLFGGMILVTAGVAGLGAWQMNRAFRRQLALNAEKSNFVASVSHELRTPLASLRLLAEGLAAGRVEDESKRHEYAGFLVQETRRLGALVENVLDFARIEQGRKQYQFEPTDLGRLVTATVRLFEPLAAERQVRLELNLPAGSAEPGGSLELNADGAALQQALVNLLDNALKHAPADSAVTVALEGADRAPLGRVRLSVSDAGPGIPLEDHERIFERFFRRGSELRRETQGVGLGLAIVKHIVAAHRGRVWVESQPGQGARFVVELPLGESNQCSVASNQSVGRNDQ
jgi:signal transduction histidine kinase